jgi:hypothetical protein
MLVVGVHHVLEVGDFLPVGFQGIFVVSIVLVKIGDPSGPICDVTFGLRPKAEVVYIYFQFHYRFGFVILPKVNKRTLKKAFQRLGFCGIWILAGFGCHAQSTLGIADFDGLKHDFGEVEEEKGRITHEFKFKNTGQGPISITNCKTTCGCTVSEWTREPVQPGSSGKVVVTFDPFGRPGLFYKDIMVTTDGRPANLTLKISGKVTPRPKGPKDYYPFEEGMLRFQTNHLTFGKVFKDESPALKTIVYNQGGKPVKFSASKSIVPPHLKPVLTKMELLPGDTCMLSVTYKASLKNDWGFAFDNLLLATSDAGHPLKKINISADLLERFPKSGPEATYPPKAKFNQTEFDLGSVNEGEFPTVVFKVTNTGGHPLQFRKVSSGCSCIIPALSSTVLAPGETGQIEVKFNTRGRVGLQEKEVTVICNDPSKPETTLRIFGHVNRPATGE